MKTTTTPIEMTDTLGDLVTRDPACARVFESLGIDYCCGGNTTLEQAATEKKLDPHTIAVVLQASRQGRATDGDDPRERDPTALSTRELVRYILDRHHRYLRNELPRLVGLTGRLADAHGNDDARLHEVARIMTDLEVDLMRHLDREEQEVFAGILSRGSAGPRVDLMDDLITDHQQTGAVLARLRELTDGFTLPEWGCNTYRVVMATLRELEQDIHRHVHLENNVLFPRVVQ